MNKYLQLISDVTVGPTEFVAVLFAFLPTVIAAFRGHRNIWWMIAANILIVCAITVNIPVLVTLAGWMALLFWAFKSHIKK